MQKHHYYVFTAFGWSTAATLRKAIAGLRRSGLETSPFGGPIHVGYIKVLLPPEAPYQISYCKPVLDDDQMEWLDMKYGQFMA